MTEGSSSPACTAVRLPLYPEEANRVRQRELCGIEQHRYIVNSGIPIAPSGSVAQKIDDAATLVQMTSRHSDLVVQVHYGLDRLRWSEPAFHIVVGCIMFAGWVEVLAAMFVA
jgi:hypothetical protein